MLRVNRRRIQVFSVRLGVLVAAAALLLPTVALAQADCEGAQAIRRLGSPSTRFSAPVASRDALLAAFEAARIDVEMLLRDAGWAGNPDDLYQAIRTGNVTQQSFAPGQRFGWMFMRKGGQPKLSSDVCWAGGENFQGWEIQFTSRGQWYSMVVPEACGNLSFLAQQAEPVCSVSASDAAGRTCDDPTITVNASGSTGNVSVQVTTPSGSRRTLNSGNASSPLRWSFDSDERAGTFNFALSSTETTPRGTTLQCSADTSLERSCCDRKPPTIDLMASSNEVEQCSEITISASAAVASGGCAQRITKVTVDGEEVSVPFERNMSWMTPGSYTISATATDDAGGTAEDSVTITVNECATRQCRKACGDQRGRRTAGNGWILRPFLTGASMDDRVDQSFDNNNDRRTYILDSAESGIGLAAEYKFSPRLGLGLGALVATSEIELMHDIGELWVMEEDDLSITSIFGGPLFHLTPDSRVDFFIGPVIAFTDLGDVQFNTLGVQTRRDFDSEFGIGAQAGLDIPFTAASKWGLYLGAMFLDVTAESDPQDFELEMDPLFFNVGLSYTFDR